MAERKRVRSTPRHRTLRLSKKKLKQPKPLPGVLSLFRHTVSVIKANKKLFLGIAVVNLIASVLLVQGLGGSNDIVDLKNELEELFTDEDKLSNTLALFAFLLGSAGTTSSESGTVYQLVVMVIISLAVIWGVRQVLAGEKPRIRDTFYKGMYPLIPFVGILVVIAIQLIPLLIGNLLYSTVVNNSLATTTAETIIWILIFILLALLSGYMLTSSIFALYISTLPDMAPFKALRSARELVLHRRLSVWLRILALPLLLTVISAVIFIPILMVSVVAAQILFMVAVSISLVAFNIYMYLLYRSLL